MLSALHWFTRPTACRRRLLSSCVLLVSVVVFIIPATGDSSHLSQPFSPRSGLLVPLYIYPVRGAWDPLYQAIQSHPSVDFTVVINPASGPGTASLPDANYTREIARLNSFSNVRTVGYVHIDYSKRPIEQATADISRYAAWSGQNRAIAMQGIFLDESPQRADDFNISYVTRVRQTVKSTQGLSSGTLVMNPGNIPEPQILALADKTVVFEEQYQTYLNRQAAKSLAALPDRSVLVCLMHSVPSAMPEPQLKSLVNELRELSGTMFLTDLSENYYERFSPRFQEFVNALA